MAEEPRIIVDIEVNMALKQFGDFQLIDSLGIGGCAEVFKAKHLPSGKQVAVKLYKASVKQVERQFLNEARLAANLQHPHIIRVFSFGIEGDIPYLSMSYASKGSLDKLHSKGTTLPLSIIVSYVNQIASALQYAHDQRVIHRDIKPANILVEEDGQLLVADFGIAEIAHSTLSFEEQQVAGTFLYMPPEQFEGRAERASDQYALGFMVYEWLCGETPFTGPIGALSAPPPPLHEKISISSTVETVVLRALAKEPGQRFLRIADFANALEKAYIEEIRLLLSVAQQAAKLLTQGDVQHILFDSLIRDSHWWNTIGLTMIKSLRSQADQVARKDIIALLSTLTEGAMRELEDAIQREDEESVVNLLDLIYYAAPPSIEPSVWVRLLDGLSANLHAVTFITNTWHIYAALLQLWGNVSPNMENEHLRHWFPKTWSRLWQFLALPLPAEWYDMAVTNLLDIASTTPLPAPIVRSAENEYASSLQKYLDCPFRSYQQQHVAILLFAKLVESSYAKKMELLHIMLISGVGSREPKNYVERVLVAAQLNEEEIKVFLETYGEEIKSYYQLPIVLDYARRYVFAFNLDDLDRPDAKHLIQFLSRNLSLPTEVQARARNWYTVASFIDRPISNWQELTALANALVRLPYSTRELIEKLVVPFTSCIKSDIDLMNVIRAMNTIFAGPELLRFLYRLATSVGTGYKSNYPESILVPYIQIALEIENIVHDVPLMEQQKFVRQFLDILLQNAKRNNKRRLSAIARNWHPDLNERWQRYVQNA